MSVQYARRHRESSGSFAMCLRGFLVCLFDFVCVCVCVCVLCVGVCVCVLFCFVFVQIVISKFKMLAEGTFKDVHIAYNMSSSPISSFDCLDFVSLF